MPIFDLEKLQNMPKGQIVTECQAYPAALSDRLLFPEECTENAKIILTEFLRYQAAADGDLLDYLKQFVDFREYTEPRRPNPSFEQWMLVYQSIGFRPHTYSFDDILPMMRGRDALIPFILTAPCADVRCELVDAPVYVGDVPLPYPMLEKAVNDGAFAKIEMLNDMCGTSIPYADIAWRALFLNKGDLLCDLIGKMPTSEKAGLLWRFISQYHDLCELVAACITRYEDELADWTDRWGNSFFWYMYFAEPMTKDFFNALPESLKRKAKEKNVFGISAQDLWETYRPVLKITEKTI